MISIAIIGGTGVYAPSMLENVEESVVVTPYGDVKYQLGVYDGKQVAFLPRHGSKHSIPPHLINYRGNIWALKKLGVTHILTTTAVGSLNPAMKPGDFVLVDQFLDFTKHRVSTFYDGGKRGVVYADVTEPYCPQLRQAIKRAADSLGLDMHENGVYVCTEGPRFETPAEIRMFAKLGGDLVGMTCVPEVVLAHEAEMCYATVSMVTNYGAGISSHQLTHKEVLDVAATNLDRIKALMMKCIETIDFKDRHCACAEVLSEHGGFKL